MRSYICSYMLSHRPAIVVHKQQRQQHSLRNSARKMPQLRLGIPTPPVAPSSDKGGVVLISSCSMVLLFSRASKCQVLPCLTSTSSLNNTTLHLLVSQNAEPKLLRMHRKIMFKPPAASAACPGCCRPCRRPVRRVLPGSSHRPLSGCRQREHHRHRE